MDKFLETRTFASVVRGAAAMGFRRISPGSPGLSARRTIHVLQTLDVPSDCVYFLDDLQPHEEAAARELDIDAFVMRTPDEVQKVPMPMAWLEGPQLIWTEFVAAGHRGSWRLGPAIADTRPHASQTVCR
jgi:hypothetical protein